MTHQELLQTLKTLGLHATKARGQNFLHEESILRRIVAAAPVNPGDTVVEVGPGLGTLTVEILAAGATLTSIELDRGLAAHLRTSLADRPGFTLVEGDALRELPALLRARPGTKVVANIPYNITTPLLEILSTPGQVPAVAVLTVQKELAERLCAVPRTKAYGAMTVLLQSLFTIETAFLIKAGSFFPPPKVDSATIRLTPRTEPPPQPFDRFQKLVRMAFSQRRKMLRKMIQGWSQTPLEDVLRELGLNPLARPEELSVADWARLHGALLTRR